MSITVEDHPAGQSPDRPSGDHSDQKSELVNELVTQVGRLPAPSGLDLERLVRLYFRDVSDEELEGRTARQMGAGLLHHLALAGERPAGTSTVSVETPSLERDGWSMEGRTVVQVVTDDMPFLVDSVQMALHAEGHDPLLLIHPQLLCRRDPDGALRGVDRPSRSAAGANPGTVAQSVAESWMHLEVDPVGPEEEQALHDAVASALSDVRRAVQDWPQMQAKAEQLARRLDRESGQRVGWETDQATAFLRWLADDHFTFLGYREYDGVRRGDGDVVLRPVPGTGLGILRDGDEPAADEAAPAVPQDGWIPLLHIAKAADRSTVHRQTHLDQIGLRKVDASGAVVGERRFLGLFSSTAYTEAVNRIPVLREKAQRVLTLSGFEPSSHAGKAVMDVLESYPRDELFQTTPERLVPIAQAVNHIRDKRQLRLFVRRDDYGRFVSCVVYLPRDRYNTQVRERLTSILREQTGAEDVEFTARVSESVAARLHFVARPRTGETLDDIDVDALEVELAAASRSWADDVVVAAPAAAGSVGLAPAEALRLLRQHADAAPEAYKEDYPSADGARDLLRMAGMGPDEVQISLAPGDGSEARLKLFCTGEPLSLSAVLPVLTTLGVDVVDERPYTFTGMPHPTHLYDFGLARSAGWPVDRVTDVEEAVHAVWDGRAEADRFNALVLDAGLTWRQVGMLRAYGRYLRQGRTPYSWEYVEDTLRANAAVATDLVALFEARFDPAAADSVEQRDAACEELRARITAELDEVASLDHDRILRSMLGMVLATLRTNYFQLAGPEDALVGNVTGERHPYLSFKLDPREVPDLPDPRPRFEIFVYSPRVEGVHLRFGPVARGGLRWSDRRDDYRTEILGLVKAQMVKNTVIVPVGAKGGFYAKRLPDPGVDRDAWLAEGIACYRTFISGLLDLTDNLVEGEVSPPTDVVRHDGDDTYLVVAADKGTATFSDIANAVSANYGFWLGDAFASGGSVGYDHKAMGITARGAWVSVQRHFRERGIDCQTQDFTCVGIGDMSGDVFGNGMLCSEHTRLVAAFDHRDIFLDPTPDAASSYAERERLFALPRSSWQDYDTELISAGGGIYPRSAKSVPITPEVRAALALDDEVTALSPPELIRAILLAPVDLLWNGGIGTYVKSAAETNAEVGDKANDAIRVDGAELRCACVGEGGNLGLTQLGRIEYARAGFQASTGGDGGRVNTDFIDNSAGVDTSDHEVNIKILLQDVVEKAPGDGGMSVEDRDTLLASMTDEVASLVLTDNDQQNLALANAVDRSYGLLHVHEHLMRTLEHDGRLDRELEGLPSRREVAARIERAESLSTPELCVLLAYVKILLAEELAEKGAAAPGDPAVDLAADPLLHGLLSSYFPHELVEQQHEAIETHPLRREIVITQVVNRLVNGAGITYLHRLGGETGAGDVELTRAHFIAREIFGTDEVMREIHAQDFVVDAAVQTRMRIEVRTLLERVSRWLVDNHRLPLDSEKIVGRYDAVAQQVVAELPSLMSGRELAAYEERRDNLVGQGVPEGLAGRIAALPPEYQVVTIVETAQAESLDPTDVARVHFALGERLGLPTLVQRILALPRTDRWQSMARAALRDDLHGAHSRLTRQILGSTAAEESAAARVADWEAEDEHRVSMAAATLDEICADETADLARLSVGLRVVRSLLA